MKKTWKKWVGDDFDVSVDVNDVEWSVDLTISVEVQKVTILVVAMKRAKSGDFEGFGGLEEKGPKSDVCASL